MSLDEHNEAIGIPRTTNAIEHFFRLLKRLHRRVHGRGNLRRDLLHLPPELPLIANLTNPIYLQLTIGTLKALPEPLSQHAEKTKRLIKEQKVDCSTSSHPAPQKNPPETRFPG